jgi:hypothetical protein
MTKNINKIRQSYFSPELKKGEYKCEYFIEN